MEKINFQINDFFPSSDNLNKTVSFEAVGEILDGVADEIPQEFFKELNGGVILLPDVKIHPESKGVAKLYILGEYHYQRYGLGRYIAIYYGSFIKVCGHMAKAEQKAELRKTLLHEFTHHLESLAGERGLEIKDAQKMYEYKQRYKNFRNI